ncbi:MAG TPA: YciI family protein [Pyrinomonadaceae bacterium]|nr:YciI family protein [Pyrinomonadaceae bacterium]
MKYMLLIHHVDDTQIPEAQRVQLLSESVQLCHDLNANGQYIDAAPLHPSTETIQVTVRDGKRLVTDGPFAETREQIGGYFMVEAGSMEEAVEIAGRIPGATIGTVEVRPVREVEGLPAKN